MNDDIMYSVYAQQLKCNVIIL